MSRRSFRKAFRGTSVKKPFPMPFRKRAFQRLFVPRHLSKSSDLLRSVVRPESGEFFERNGLLFKGFADVEKSIGGLTKAQPLISGLAGTQL
jgi:hypothetical protein